MKLDLPGLKLKKNNKNVYYNYKLFGSQFKGSEMILKNGKLTIKPDGSNPIHKKLKLEKKNK